MLISLLLVACTNDNHHKAHDDGYTCPMHPTVTSDKPGTCPVCGMDLVRKARPGEEVKVTEDLKRQMRSPDQSVVSSSQTVKGEYKSMPVSLVVAGVVTYDTRNVYVISAKVSGRIENMRLKFEYQRVKKGEKIAEIFSPELITAQRELLYLLEKDADNDAMIDQSKKKLELLGLTTAQINELITLREVKNVVATYSPYDGYVIVTGLKSSTAQPSADNEMGEMTPSSNRSGQTNSKLPAMDMLREGDYVAAGQALVKIVNTNAIRIELDVPSTSAEIRTGDKIEVDPGTGKTEQAIVDFIQPFYNQGENFVKIRVYAPGNNNLLIGQFVKATIKLKSPTALWVPQASVVDLGIDKVVFIKDRDLLKPKKIITGLRANSLIEVKSGLATSDEIALNAQYLVDSESFIKPVN